MNWQIVLAATFPTVTALAGLVTAILLSGRIEARSAQIENRIEAMRLEVKSDLKEFRSEIRADLAGIRGEIVGVRGEIADLRGEMKALDTIAYDHHGRMSRLEEKKGL